MNIAISRADESHLRDCVAALANSELGRIYFPSEEKALASLAEGVAREEVFVALDDARECLGFIWFILGGAFHSYPYLHVIAVKQEHRGEGVGKELLRFFEEGVFENSSKAFLVVADFNPDARRLYERLGYRQVGAIPGLYREGVTEYLMMKSKNEPIYHIVSETDFRAHNDGFEYVPADFASSGFVHCALEASVLPVANDYYAGVDEPLLLLRIDPARLKAATRYEAAAPDPTAGASHLATSPVFPHVYGPIDLAAIDGVGVLTKGEHGYAWPPTFSGAPDSLGD